MMKTYLEELQTPESRRSAGEAGARLTSASPPVLAVTSGVTGSQILTVTLIHYDRHANARKVLREAAGGKIGDASYLLRGRSRREDIETGFPSLSLILALGCKE
jgi:hypothetical protein